MKKTLLSTLFLSTAIALLTAGTASATDPGRWTLAGKTELPYDYYQGVTLDVKSNWFFDGVIEGLYRTSKGFTETGRNATVIPAAVKQRESYNHVGDLSYDKAEGGRILLPLECFYPGQPNDGNTCQTGSFGVANSKNLKLSYYVKLNPSVIKKAMWVEVSPDGRLAWTQNGRDLLAFPVSKIKKSNAGPSGKTLSPVKTVKNAIPADVEVTGAAFYKDRLFTAWQTGEVFTVYSYGLKNASSRLELEQNFKGESEGLAVGNVAGGELHWQVMPVAPPGTTPSFTAGKATLLHFKRAG